MQRTTLVCAIAIGLWPVVAACQSPPANSLPAPMRAHLTGDRFDVVTSVRGLPLGVREELQTLFRASFLDIADPDAAFRATDDAPDATLPTRRLAVAACSTTVCLVYYERGGTAHSWHIAMFSWTPALTKLEWGGIAPAGLRTFDELRKLALSGSITVSDTW